MNEKIRENSFFPYADLFDEILCDKSIYYAVLECDDVYLIFTPSFLTICKIKDTDENCFIIIYELNHF